MSKFWTLPRWRCPRCSGQPPAPDDIHDKKVFLHLTGISHLATCACCTQSCHHKPLRRVELLVLCILPLGDCRQQKSLPWVLLSFCQSTLCCSPTALKQWINVLGAHPYPRSPKTVFPLAVLRHRCTPRMKDLPPGEVQLSCSNQLCAHFSSHTGKWNQTNKSWSQQTADNGESLSYGNSATCGHKPEAATIFFV